MHELCPHTTWQQIHASVLVLCTAAAHVRVRCQTSHASHALLYDGVGGALQRRLAIATTCHLRTMENLQDIGCQQDRSW
jgi:hypothetical protein